MLLLAARSSAAAEATAKLEITGRALGVDGSGLAGATVELLAIPSEYRRLLDESLGKREVVARAATDREGWFQLVAPSPGMWTVVVSASGRLAVEYPLVPLVEPQRLPPATLPLSREAEIRVLAAGGEPIAGAVVLAEGPSTQATREPGWVPHRAAAHTDSQGRAMLPDSAAQPGRARVSAVGFSSQEIALGGLRTVTLDPVGSAAIEVAVSEMDGRPVAQALVTARGQVLAVTGADGRSRLPGREAHGLTVIAPDGRQARLAGCSAGAPCKLSLSPPKALIGAVLDRESRTPLAAAVAWYAGDPGSWTLTDPRGAYALRDPGPTARRLAAVASGHLGQQAAVATPTRIGSRGPNLALIPVATLAGQVIDAVGRPVPGAELRANIVHPAAQMRFGLAVAGERALSGRDGAFALHAIARNEPYRIVASADGLAPVALVWPGDPSLRPAPLRIVLGPGHGTSGRVVDETGAPVAGARIEALFDAQTADRLKAAAGALGGSRAASRGVDLFEAQTRADGTFRLDHLPDRRCDLVVRKDGFAPATFPGIELGGQSGDLDWGTLVLARGVEISGVVTAGGKALAGARVTVRINYRGPDGQLVFSGASVATDDHGRFRLTGLTEGESVDLIVEHAGYSRADVPKVTAPPARPLAIALVRAAGISGHVLAEDGSPIAGAQVQASPEDTAVPRERRFDYSARTAEDGGFSIDDLPPGLARIEVSARGYEPARRSGLEVPREGRLSGVEVRLSRGGVVWGTVVAADGLPAVGVEVSGGGSSTSTDGDGAYRLEGVMPGRQRIVASQPDLRPASREVAVEAGLETRLDLILGAGGLVGGSTVSRSGELLTGIVVQLRPTAAGTVPRRTTSDAAGQFHFAGVDPGHYEISTVQARSAAPGSALPLDVGDDPITDLELPVDDGGVIAGRVLGLGPADLASLTVAAQRARSETAIGELSPDGSYRIAGLGAGDWSVTALVVATGRRAQGTASLAEGDGEARLDLRLSQGVTLAGAVRDDGQPLGGADLVLTSADGLVVGRDRTDAQGYFRMEGLGPSDYQLVVAAAEGDLSQTFAVDLREDRSLALDLSSGPLSGTVVEAGTGQSLADAEVLLQSDAGSASRSTISDEMGHFGFARVLAGSYRIVVRKDGFSAAAAEVQVTESGAPPVALTLSRAAAR